MTASTSSSASERVLNLFVCSDGTGNAGGKTRGTNVWRFYNLVDRVGAAPEQRAYYDDGVGTADSVFLKGLGSLFGVGISANLCAAYVWLVLNYDPVRETRIHLLGFSRGAFTARCLAGMLSICGLLRRDEYLAIPPAQRAGRVREILGRYRARRPAAYDTSEAAAFRKMRVWFVGVWDTVDAVGLPIQELGFVLRAGERLRTKRFYAFTDRELIDVEHGRHALALDDERRSFHPNLWRLTPGRSEPSPGCLGGRRRTSAENIKQVWFAGMHSNVGGGYPKDGLAHVALDWMMGEIEELSGGTVRWRSGARHDVRRDSDPHGLMYDSRGGLARYYRYSRRRPAWFHLGIDDFWPRQRSRLARRVWWTRDMPIEESMTLHVHRSVFDRIERGTQAYAPLWMLPAGTVLEVETTFSEGERAPVSPELHDLVGSVHRVATQQSDLHAWVLLRQCCNALAIAATVLGLGLGLVADAPESSVRGVEWSKALAPGLLHPVLDAAMMHPVAAGVLCALVMAGLVGGFRIRRAVEHRVQRRYHEVLSAAPAPEQAVTDLRSAR